MDTPDEQHAKDLASVNWTSEAYRCAFTADDLDDGEKPYSIECCFRVGWTWDLNHDVETEYGWKTKRAAVRAVKKNGLKRVWWVDTDCAGMPFEGPYDERADATQKAKELAERV